MLKDYTFKAEDTKKNIKDRKSDVITVHTEDKKIHYPLLKLKCKEINLFMVKVLQGLLEKKSQFANYDGHYNVYIEMNGQLGNIGILKQEKLKVILDDTAFKIFEKEVWLDKDTKITGDMLYALCISNI